MPIINSSEIIYLNGGELDFEIEVEFIAVPHVIGENQAAFPFNFNFDAFPRLRLDTSSRIEVTVDIVPFTNTGFYEQYKFRLYVDGSEIAIQSFNLDAPENKIGFNLDLTLTRPIDRNLITNEKEYKFQIGVVKEGITTWYTLVEFGKLVNKGFVIQWGDVSPADSSRFSISSLMDDKLEKVPTQNVVFYDPTRLTIQQSEFEKIYDTEGRVYETDLIPILTMRLYTLFDRIFVARCGFDGFVTNIPNYQIRRADFNITSSYVNGISPLIGMFSPVFYEVDNVLWIIDTTQILPEGFPLPLALTCDNYRKAAADYQNNTVDAIMMDYIETEIEPVFFTTRLETRTETSGTFGDDDFIRTDIEETWRDYKKVSQPDVTIRSILEQEHLDTLDANLTTIQQSSLVNTFDSLGRQLTITKTLVARVPDLNDEGTLTLQTVKEEFTNIFYGAHPFRPNEQVQKRMIKRVRGLIAVDSNNQYFEQDFRQDFINAHRAGNLNVDMTTEEGAIMTVDEQIIPQSNGILKLKITTTDHVRNVVTEDITEPRAGEAVVSSSGSSKPMLVFLNDGDILLGNGVESFSIGELPLEYGIPLVKRILKKRKEKPYKFNVDLSGFEAGVRRGMTYSIFHREDGTIGSMIVESFNLSGNADNNGATTVDTNIRGQQI